MIEKFDIEKAKKMSNDQVMALVCKGLSEVASDFSKIAKDKKTKQKFEEQAKHFSALSKIFKSKKS